MSVISSKLDYVFRSSPDDYIGLRYDSINNRCIICKNRNYSDYPIVTFDDIINNKIPAIIESRVNDNYSTYEIDNVIVSLDGSNNIEFYSSVFNLAKIQTIVAVAMIFGFPVSPKFTIITNYYDDDDDYVVLSECAVIINVNKHPMILIHTNNDNCSDTFELHCRHLPICKFQISDNEFIEHLKSELWRYYESCCD